MVSRKEDHDHVHHNHGHDINHSHGHGHSHSHSHDHQHDHGHEHDHHNVRNSQRPGQQAAAASHAQLDAFGTPMPVRAPINFEQRLEKQKSRTSAYKKRLIAVSVVLLFFITTQFAGGYIAGSLGLLTGPAMMSSELLGFGMSISALSNSAASAQAGGLTFGWHRAEVVGTLLQISTVWVLMGWMLIETWNRFLEPVEIEADVMLIVAVMGFIFNLIQMKILHSGEGHYDPGEEVQQAHSHGHGHAHSHSHQERAKNKIKDSEVKKTLLDNEEGHQAEHNHAHGEHTHHHDSHSHAAAVAVEKPHDPGFFAVICNILMSLALIGVATLIYFFPWMAMGDLVYVCVFALVVLCTTIPTASEAITVMMEGTPKSINVEQMRQDIEDECGNDITDIHDLHVWTISMGNVAMTCHIQSTKPLKTLAQVTDVLRRKHNLYHTAIQVEGIEDKERNPHSFKCENDIHQ